MFNVYSILKKSKLTHIVLTVAMFLSTLSVVQASDVKSLTYFTGIGCPHCANVSPTIHSKINSSDGLLMIEYELYKESSNAKVLADYSDRFGFNLAIPLVVYKPQAFDLGDDSIISSIDTQIAALDSNIVQLSDREIRWEDLNINEFTGKPKIFSQNRVAIKNGTKDTTSEENSLIKNFLTNNDVNNFVTQLSGGKVDELSVEYPGGTEIYDNGVSLGSWTLLWRGSGQAQIGETATNEDDNGNSNNKISWLKIGTLALTDSINPCALSVLLMMLVAIATYHPKNKRQILWSGLAFVAAVFITYFIYGLLIVKAFDVIQGITSIKDYLYKGLGTVAIILGLLEIKDFFFYKPGGIGTEMPLFFRPKVQSIIAKITSPIGAFGLGMFVTLFLLPCTIGPYVILGGMLSYGEFANSLPYLSVYNLIFVLPMIVIILAVFFGAKDIKQVTEWKEKNVKVMHLVIGIIFILLGSTMVFGLF